MSSFSYDAENRLVAASGGVGLVYDPLGRLFQVTGGSGTTQFLYDGDALVAEYNSSGTMLRRYVHGAGADVPLVWYEGAGLSSKRFLYPDSQGSIVAVTDGAASVTNVNSYDEYGIPAAGNTGRFQYTGQAWIPELGMYHYKARVYSPVLGRFLQTDPIGYKDQKNLYTYVRNDPVTNLDPTGQDIEVYFVVYRMGEVPTGPWGHAFVYYRDTESGETRILRGGPSCNFPGDASRALLNQGAPDTSGKPQTVKVSDALASKSPDNIEGLKKAGFSPKAVDKAVIKGSFSDFVVGAQKYRDQVNSGSNVYGPRGPNSNSVSVEFWQQTTGRKPENNSGVDLWGSGSDLRKSPPEPAKPCVGTFGGTAVHCN